MDRGLNPAQRAAVEHGEGPLLVLAGPGSGKTRVVTHRIARLLDRGISAQNVIAATFTNKAAREMRARVKALVGKRAKGLTVSTIHSACVRILRQEIEALGYGRNFSIYDEASQQSLVRTLLRDMRGAGATNSASAVVAGVGQIKSGEEPEASGEKPEEARAFLTMAAGRYQEELRARNAVDFDDIILLTRRLFEEHEEVLARWRERFQWLLVDEYQDTNESQDRVLSLLAGPSGNITVVGDDDQSIYRWRGARVEHIIEFPRRVTGCRVVKLEQNYRSTGHVVAVANAVVRQSANRHPKTIFTESGLGDPVSLVDLPDDTEEADYIAGEIGKDVHAPGADQWKAASGHAVLFRTNEQSRVIEQALRQAQIPYSLLGGRSFFDRKEVLDVVAYLRLAVNRDDDEAFFRIVNTPSRGVGAKTLQALRDQAAREGVGTWHVLERASAGDMGIVSARAAGPLREFVNAMRSLDEAAEKRTRTLVSDFLRRIGYQAEIERTYKDDRVRASRVALALEVQSSWEGYLEGAAKPALLDFLDSLSLRDRDTDDDKGGGVTLATVHASKGLEFRCVHVAGVEEGNFPHSKSMDDGPSLEEERRLFYVAVTRAQRRLVLTRAVTRHHRGKEIKTQRSRFAQGLPEASIDEGNAHEPATEDSVAGHLARMRAALRAPGD